MKESAKYPKHFESKFYFGRGLAQIIPSGVWTQIQLDTISIDSLDECDDAITYDFVPKKSGYYVIHGQIRWGNIRANTNITLAIARNGGYTAEALFESHAVNQPVTMNTLWMAHLNAGDSIELWTHHNSGFNEACGGHWMGTHLTGFRIG